MSEGEDDRRMSNLCFRFVFVISDLLVADHREQFNLLFQMKSVIFYTFILLSLNQVSVDGSPNGAPAGACDGMIPNHGGSTQACSTIYTIETDKSSFGANEAVQGKTSQSEKDRRQELFCHHFSHRS